MNTGMNFTKIDLVDIAYSAIALHAELVLKYPEDEMLTVLTCRNVLLFKISNFPDDMEPAFVVDIVVGSLHGASALSALNGDGYDCTPSSMPAAVHHVHVDGGPVIDIYSSELPQLTVRAV